MEKGKPRLRAFSACKLKVYYISRYVNSFDRNYSKMGKILTISGPGNGNKEKL